MQATVFYKRENKILAFCCILPSIFLSLPFFLSFFTSSGHAWNAQEEEEEEEKGGSQPTVPMLLQIVKEWRISRPSGGHILDS